MLRGEQIRAARSLLGWSQTVLAEAARISLPTIKRLEAHGVERSAVATAEAIRKALEGAGVQFLERGNAAAGPGVARRSDLEAGDQEHSDAK